MFATIYETPTGFEIGYITEVDETGYKYISQVAVCKSGKTIETFVYYIEAFSYLRECNIISNDEYQYWRKMFMF